MVGKVFPNKILTIMNSSNPNLKDIHTRHCSINTCKYGDDVPNEDGYIECTVVSKRGVPEYLHSDDEDPEWYSW